MIRRAIAQVFAAQAVDECLLYTAGQAARVEPHEILHAIPVCADATTILENVTCILVDPWTTLCDGDGAF